MNSLQLKGQEGLECAICFSYLRDPVLTICGHRFCSSCLTVWLSEHESRCPIDNRELSPNDTFPDNYTKREIAGIFVTCPNNDCAESVPVNNFEEHCETCNFKEKFEIQVIECPFKSVGCTCGSVSTSVALQTHLKNNLQNHLQLMLQAFNHLESNFQSCRNMCPHNEGCLQNGENMDTLNGKLPYYLNDVYEKLTELDQLGKESAIKINNLTIQIKKCYLETNFCKPPTLDMNDGVLLWRINGFDEIIDQLRKDPQYFCYSPVFSTSEFGYRFCVRLGLSNRNDNALAIRIHVVKGNFDFLLKWPFVGEISISILHPLNPNLRLKSVIKTNSSEAFHRPLRDINPYGFGFNGSISVYDLKTQGYLQGNTLIAVVCTKSYE